MCSREEQKTKLEYSPPVGPRETSSVNPCTNSRGLKLPDTPLMLFLSKMSGEGFESLGEPGPSQLSIVSLYSVVPLKGKQVLALWG